MSQRREPHGGCLRCLSPELYDAAGDVALRRPFLPPPEPRCVPACALLERQRQAVRDPPPPRHFPAKCGETVTDFAALAVAQTVQQSWARRRSACTTPGRAATRGLARGERKPRAGSPLLAAPLPARSRLARLLGGEHPMRWEGWVGDGRGERGQAAAVAESCRLSAGRLPRAPRSPAAAPPPARAPKAQISALPGRERALRARPSAASMCLCPLPLTPLSAQPYQHRGHRPRRLRQVDHHRPLDLQAGRCVLEQRASAAANPGAHSRPPTRLREPCLTRPWLLWQASTSV